MKIFNNRSWMNKIIGGFTILALILSPVTPFAFADHDPFGGAEQTSVQICHTTGNGGYIVNSPSISSTGGNISFTGGHANHDDDIIPPFHFSGGLSYPGKNWTSDNEQIWNNGDCKGVITPPNADPVITVSGSNPDSVVVGSGVYSDPGATCTDTEDGSITVTATGSVNTSAVGNYTITYTCTDSGAKTVTDTRTVMVTAAPINNAPIVTLNGAVSVEVFQGDVFVDAGASCTDIEDGSLVVTITGSVNTTILNTYVITYSCTDTANQTDSEIRTVLVKPVPFINTAPQAVDDSVVTTEDVNASGNVLTNDIDVDNNPLTVALVADVTNGTLTLNTDGSFTYIPNAAFNGSDSFTYRANDGTDNSNVATVTITVNAVNNAPVANDDSVSTDEDTLVNGNVLTNDTDTNSVSLTATKTIDPIHGTVDINTDGTFTYTPAPDYFGPDSFKYQISDESAASTEATVTVTVNAVNDVPTIILNGQSSVNITVDGTFNDPSATCSDVEDVTITAAISGTVDMSTVGSYILSYTCTDSDNATSNSVARTVNVVAAPVNNPPIVTINGNSTVTLTQGDTYTDAGAVCTDPEQGNLSVGTTGAADTSVVGTYTITYTCTDNEDNTDTETRTIIVNAPQQQPTDVCPNISGAQAAIPSGYKLNSSGDCVKKSSGSSGGGFIGSTQPVGEVLGAQTSCGIYVDKYLKKGLKGNDKNTVTKVQEFLNTYTKTSLVLDGLFGGKTEAALKAFQLSHKDKILDPWKLAAPTGIFYLTTQAEVNNIMCPELQIPVPTNLIPFSANPNTPKV